MSLPTPSPATTKSAAVATVTAPSSLVRFYAAWNPTEDPPKISAELMAADIAVLAEANRPAGDLVAIVRAMERTIRMYPSAGDDRAAALAEGYREVLSKLPTDIALAALEEVRANCTFLPMPAEINTRAQALMAPRIQALAKARVMARRLRDLPPARRDPTPDEQAAVGEEVGRLAARMRTREAARAAEGPLGRPLPDQAAAAEDRSTAIRRATDALKGFRLPDESDPAVQAILQRGSR